jgi:uncharacterized membrane protein HdeD (DUF308 family)
MSDLLRYPDYAESYTQRINKFTKVDLYMKKILRMMREDMKQGYWLLIIGVFTLAIIANFQLFWLVFGITCSVSGLIKIIHSFISERRRANNQDKKSIIID